MYFSPIPTLKSNSFRSFQDSSSKLSSSGRLSSEACFVVAVVAAVVAVVVDFSLERDNDDDVDDEPRLDG